MPPCDDAEGEYAKLYAHLHRAWVRKDYLTAAMVAQRMEELSEAMVVHHETITLDRTLIHLWDNRRQDASSRRRNLLVMHQNQQKARG